ncbi:hypothetical protein L1887_57729 [Cichorium endivia]|nr:hypothetical protein L1887_57729 [Cichorium endivia]
MHAFLLQHPPVARPRTSQVARTECIHRAGLLFLSTVPTDATRACRCAFQPQSRPARHAARTRLSSIRAAFCPEAAGASAEIQAVARCSWCARDH